MQLAVENKLKYLFLLLIASILSIMTMPNLSYAAEHYDSKNGGWVCAHGYYTFTDKHLTGGCFKVNYWYSAADYNRDGNSVKGSTIASGATKWSDSDSSISLKKRNNNTVITFSREKLSSNILAETCFYKKDGTQLKVTSKKSLSTNYKYCYIYTSEAHMAKLRTSAERISTISHEIGHALGLSHRNLTPSSIMCQTSSNRTAKGPSTSDVKSVKHIY